MVSSATRAASRACRRRLSVSAVLDARCSTPPIAMERPAVRSTSMVESTGAQRPHQTTMDAELPSAGPSTPTLYQLRPYQMEAIEACVSALDRGVLRIGVSSPTGSGKTVMLCVENTSMVALHLLMFLVSTHLIPRLIGGEGDEKGQILILLGAIGRVSVDSPNTDHPADVGFRLDLFSARTRSSNDANDTSCSSVANL
jgi:hypothetical protein